MSDTPVPIEELLAERDWLAALARRLVADAGIADDLAQETWVAALTRPPRHRRGLRGWLATVLRNRAHDARDRADRERRRAERSASAADVDDPAEVVAQAELEQRVARLTLGLPEPYRATLLMRYHRGLTPKEIAERLGEPASTVRSRLKRGIDMLRDRLDRDHEGDRRRWAVLLAPLARRAPATGGTLMLTAPMKAAVLVVALATAGSGAAVILAEPREEPKSPALEIASAPPPVPAEEEETDAPKPPEKKPSLLDEKTSVDFQDATVLEALEMIRTTTGLRYELARGVDAHLEGSATSLKADDITIRSLVDIVATVNWLECHERSDGSIYITARPRPPRPPHTHRSASDRPWFGAGRGLIPVPTGEPIPATLLPDGLELSLGKEPLGGTYWAWLRLIERPDLPVLIRADPAAPAPGILRLRSLAGGREIRLDTGDGTGLLLPGSRLRETADLRIRVSVQYRRPGTGTKDPGELVRQLEELRNANPGKRIHLDVYLDEEATARHLATLLGAAERLGFVPTVRTTNANAGRTARETAHVYWLVVARDVVVTKKPPAPVESAFRSLNLCLSGRPGRRNLRAEGGSAGSEDGVALGLAWLATRQDEDGSWGGDVEDTARALLAFLAGGGRDRFAEYRGQIDRGLVWLEGREEASGPATIAFAEAWALTGDPRWRDAAEAAAARTRSGLALRLARLCGIGVTVRKPEVPGIAPADCFARILDGEVPWKSKSLAAAMNAFLEPVKDNRAGLFGADDVLLHDGTLAAFQAGGSAWYHWLHAMKPALLDTQIRHGSETGSWNPPEGGSRVRTTALGVATLTVFYRYGRLFGR